MILGCILNKYLRLSSIGGYLLIENSGNRRFLRPRGAGPLVYVVVCLGRMMLSEDFRSVRGCWEDMRNDGRVGLGNQMLCPPTVLSSRSRLLGSPSIHFHQ